MFSLFLKATFSVFLFLLFVPSNTVLRSPHLRRKEEAGRLASRLITYSGSGCSCSLAFPLGIGGSLDSVVMPLSEHYCFIIIYVAEYGIK